jgi:predicted ArsR family transcriptional regulator
MADDARFNQAVHGIAALDQPLRRAVYEALADRTRWASRDHVAEVLALSRSVAAFHLDKLVEAGLVDVRYERTSGRTGPGAGRPAKLYRRSERELSASVPERHYDLAATLFARAVDDAAHTGRPVNDALADAARRAGRDLGDVLRSERDTSSASVLATLAQQGYEPRERDGEVVLTNCPFHALAEEHRPLVCGMNLDFLSGLLDALGDAAPLDARLDYEPGFCCVRFREHERPTP